MDNSEEETNMGLKVKKSAVQVLSSAASMLAPEASGTHSHLVDSSALLPAIPPGRAFANAQNVNICKEFMNINNKI